MMQQEPQIYEFNFRTSFLQNQRRTVSICVLTLNSRYSHSEKKDLEYTLRK
jgi:hypothetical protein